MYSGVAAGLVFDAFIFVFFICERWVGVKNGKHLIFVNDEAGDKLNTN